MPSASLPPLKILVAGTYDPEVARNRRLLQQLRAAGHQIEERRAELWGSARHELVKTSKFATIRRALTAYPTLVWKVATAPKPDLLLVLYPGWVDVIILSIVARLRRVPLVFDMFISLSDTIVSDRKMVTEQSVIGQIAKLIDRFSIKCATRTIADTPVHAEFFARLGGVDRDRVGHVWLGAQDDIFLPAPTAPGPRCRQVLFYGTFIALHGLDTILRAAKELEAGDIHFLLIGTGQEQANVDKLVAQLQPTNLTFVERVEITELPAIIEQSAVCLGIFGTSEKAGRVVPNKVFESLAVGRAVVTADTPAMRLAFRADEIATVPAGDPTALAQKLRELINDPALRDSYADAGQLRYQQDYTASRGISAIDAELRTALAHVRFASRLPRRRRRDAEFAQVRKRSEHQ